MTCTFEEFGTAYDRLKQLTFDDRELFISIYKEFKKCEWAGEANGPVRGTDEAEGLIRLLNSPYWEALFKAYLIKRADHEA